VFGWFRKKPGVQDNDDSPSRIVPRLRHVDFIDAYRAQVERLAPRDGEGYASQLPVTRPFAGDLIVSYAIETPQTFVFVSAAMMAEMELNAEGMHARALQNLRAQLEGRIGVLDLDNFHALSVPDGLAACALLLPEFWDGLAAKLDGELRVAVPGQEYVCFVVEPPAGASAEEKAAAAKRRRVLKAAAISAWNESHNHSLSQHLFAWKDRQWVPVERLEAGL
jgi:hypothetical protein